MKQYNDAHREEFKQYHEANRDTRLGAMKNYNDAYREEEEMKHAKKICQERKKNIVESTRVNFTDSSHRIEMEPGEGVDRHFDRHQDCPEANTVLNHITTYKNHFTGNPENPDEYKILRDQIRGQHISPEKQRDVAQKFLLSQDRGCEWAEESLGNRGCLLMVKAETISFLDVHAVATGH
jgi:hypothetical protein